MCIEGREESERTSDRFVRRVREEEEEEMLVCRPFDPISHTL